MQVRLLELKLWANLISGHHSLRLTNVSILTEPNFTFQIIIDKIFIYTLWEFGPHVVREITNGGVGNAASELSFSVWLAMSGFTLLGRCFIASLWP